MMNDNKAKNSVWFAPAARPALPVQLPHPKSKEYYIMHYETHKLSLPGSADYARFTTYFLEVSKEIPCGLRPTVVVCPGGGYGMTSDREAEPIALAYNAAGINTVVVRYSVAPARFPTALLEVATVVRYVREHGPEFGCDPNRIFVTGFSAGGHLTASYGNFWSRPFVAETLGCDPEVLRPNGQILCYPVITCGEYAHHVMPYKIAWNDNLILSRDYILLALDFIIMWGTMMLVLLASGFNKRNTPVYTYQQPPVYQQTAPNYQQTASTYQQPIYQQPINYQQPPVYQQPPTTKNE